MADAIIPGIKSTPRFTVRVVRYLKPFQRNTAKCAHVFQGAIDMSQNSDSLGISGLLPASQDLYDTL